MKEANGLIDVYCRIVSFVVYFVNLQPFILFDIQLAGIYYVSEFTGQTR